jgi:ABC-type lipoprotein release transport system permease subunit
MLVVVIAVGAATLTVALTVQHATQRSFETFIEDHHAGHAWLFSSRERLIEIADRAYVEDAGEPVPALDTATLVSSPEPRDLSVFGVAGAQPTVTLGVMTSGRWPAAGDSREAVLDPGLARDAQVGIGDAILVATPAGIYELTVVGLAIPTSRAPFPVWDHARIFVSPESVALFNGGEPAYFAAGFRLDDPALVPQFLRGVAVAYGQSAPGARAWTDIRDSIANENEETFILGR